MYVECEEKKDKKGSHTAILERFVPRPQVEPVLVRSADRVHMTVPGVSTQRNDLKKEYMCFSSVSINPCPVSTQKSCECMSALHTRPIIISTGAPHGSFGGDGEVSRKDQLPVLLTDPFLSLLG
ncbi:hypothetical protein BaRGS_00004676 [Batillaria attramentaria]|uniref:Uncharacterized protein n=1 Tax=Batillaria attramentaria TaxID=370345 RepID=A0ABD0LWE0_9CAEN